MGRFNRRAQGQFLEVLSATRCRRRACAASTIVAALAIGQTAKAQNDYWTQTSGGSWETTSNWSANALPNHPYTDAYFNTGSGTPYTVTLPGEEGARDVYVEGDSVTFDTSNNSNQSLGVYGGVNVIAAAGQTSSLTLLGNGGYGIECDYYSHADGFYVGGAGTTYFVDNGVQLTADDSTFYFDAGSNVAIDAPLQGSNTSLVVRGVTTLGAGAPILQGTVTVGGPAAAGAVLNGYVGSEQSIFIGAGGAGTINGSAYSEQIIYVGYYYPGTLNITANSDGNTIDVGSMGVAGVLNVSSGARADGSLLTIGSHGTVVSNGGIIDFGYYNISAGCVLSFTNATFGGFLSDITLSNVILPHASTCSFQGNCRLWCNFTNDGIMNVLDQGSNVLAGLGNFNQPSDGKIVFTLTTDSINPGDEFAIGGTATLAGTLDVTAPTGFAFFNGESFTILSFGHSESGTFNTIDLPPLPVGLSWNLQNLYTAGTISVVPEPTGAGMVAVAAISLASRRRRLCQTEIREMVPAT